MNTKQTKIKFTEYRYLLENFERIINVDYHACVGQDEKNYWKDRAKTAFNKLSDKTCCKDDLIHRFERTADRSTTLIVAIPTRDFG